MIDLEIQKRIEAGDYVILDYAPIESPMPLWIYHNHIKLYCPALMVWRNIGVWDKSPLDLSDIRITENKGLRIIDK